LVKFLPDLFSDRTKENIYKGIADGKEWLAHAVRKASSKGTRK
jgi:hypothetical protein